MLVDTFSTVEGMSVVVSLLAAVIVVNGASVVGGLPSVGSSVEKVVSNSTTDKVVLIPSKAVVCVEGTIVLEFLDVCITLFSALVDEGVIANITLLGRVGFGLIGFSIVTTDSVVVLMFGTPGGITTTGKASSNFPYKVTSGGISTTGTDSSKVPGKITLLSTGTGSSGSGSGSAVPFGDLVNTLLNLTNL